MIDSSRLALNSRRMRDTWSPITCDTNTTKYGAYDAALGSILPSSESYVTPHPIFKGLSEWAKHRIMQTTLG